MDLKKVIFVFGVAMAMMATVQIVLAEESVVAVADPAMIVSSQQANTPNDMQWAWGEITSLDNQARTVTLKYLDYETDQEKDLVLVIDEKTTFENIKDLDQLKAKDALSVDYIVGVDNKNIAKNISLEKADASSVEQPVGTLAPGVAEQPVAVEPATAGLAIPADQLAAVVSPSAAVSEAPAVAVAGEPTVELDQGQLQ